MIGTLIGRKIDQMQKFLEDGRRIPVTVIAVSQNAIVQIKTQEKDGYSAVQIGFGTKKKPTKALAGHAKKAGLQAAPYLVREVKVSGDIPVAGEMIAVATEFAPGDVVKVSGTSKGKGFAGVVKRYNFRGGPKTHGQSDRHRAPGSIGQGTTPGRVYRGKRMAGRMGGVEVSVTNLTVVDIDSEANTLLVAGLIPGNKNGLVTITKTGEKKKFVPLLGVKEQEAGEILPEAASVEEPVVEEKTDAEVSVEAKEEVAVEEKEEEVKE